MHFTFEEWNLIRQAVRNWKEESEKCMNNSKVSDKELSCYQIFKRQVVELTALEDKINNSII